MLNEEEFVDITRFRVTVNDSIQFLKNYLRWNANIKKCRNVISQKQLDLDRNEKLDNA